MICKLPDGAHWGGTPIEHMNACELKLILAYKLYELKLAYGIMTEVQNKSVHVAMTDIHVPVIVRKQSEGL